MRKYLYAAVLLVGMLGLGLDIEEGGGALVP
jgi:hypothetical protein